MEDDSELRGFLHLAQTADLNFTTFRGTVRDWSHFRRIAEIQGLEWNPDNAEETGERTTRIWVSTDRQIREEQIPGKVTYGEALDELANWPLLDPKWIAADTEPIAC